jgi:hypothetical protein
MSNSKITFSFSQHYLVNIFANRPLVFNEKGHAPMFKYSASNELVEWCREYDINVPKIGYEQGNLTATFDTPSNAVLFKLCFAG